MTLGDLQSWRKKVPFFIFTFCLLPWFVIKSPALAQAEAPLKIIVPVLAELAAYFYVTLDLRRPRWKREVDTYVGSQIRTGLLDMLPNDLGVSEGERRDLAQREIFKTLTGVFWEAVDRNPVLVSHKEHFYSNGLEYTTSLDVYLICGFSGFCYAVVSLVFGDIRQAVVAAALIAVALASRLLVIPHARRSHLSLSAEQLDLLRREEGKFVSERFREIVTRWRRDRAPEASE